MNRGSLKHAGLNCIVTLLKLRRGPSGFFRGRFRKVLGNHWYRDYEVFFHRDHHRHPCSCWANRQADKFTKYVRGKHDPSHSSEIMSLPAKDFEHFRPSDHWLMKSNVEEVLGILMFELLQ
jgi:hypothetical protein